MNVENIIQQILNIFYSSGNMSSSPVPTKPSFDGTQLTLVRDTFLDVCTLGVLTIDNWSCQMIELPKVSYKGSNICIPCGTYKISKYKSPEWGFEVPLLDTSSIGRTFIEIHKSNWAIRPSDNHVFLKGCLATGLTRGENYVNSSGDAWDQMMEHIDWNKEVRIIISE
jgi:hypothetical protein